MAEYLRLLTIDDQEIPLATLQRAVPFCSVWPVQHRLSSGNDLAIGPEPGPTGAGPIWAIVERNEATVGTRAAAVIAAFLDGLELGGPPSAVRWLRDYLGRVRAIYAIRLFPEAILEHPDAIRAIQTIRETLREVVGGITEYDDFGFTNESDRLIWLIPKVEPKGQLDVALLDDSTGEWLPYPLDLSDRDRLAAFLRGEAPVIS
jgi:hypothetical protein